MEEGAGMPPCRSASLHPQIQLSEQGAGMTCRRSPCIHPQIQANEEGAGVSRPRSRVTSSVAPESPPFDDDMLREILIRLPPQPSSLPRASAVCRRGLVTDPKFLCSFRARHRKSPLLGFFDKRGSRIVFTPILDPPDRVPPARLSLGRCSSTDDYDVLNCRHGLVLVKNRPRTEVVVCDPVSGEQRRVAVPPEFKTVFFNGAVLCTAAGQGHVHGGCHSGLFKVVLMNMYRDVNRPTVCVYSSETGMWGNLVSTEASYQLGGDSDNPAILVGHALHWLSRRDAIVEFDLDGQSLAVITGPPVTNNILCQNHWIIPAEDGALGFAVLSFPRFQMWRRNVNGRGVATWVPWNCGRPLKCIQFSGSLLRLIRGGNGWWGMARIMMLYFWLWATVSTWLNLSRCNPGNFMKPSLSLNGILLQVSIHQGQPLMVDLIELKCCMIHRMLA